MSELKHFNLPDVGEGLTEAEIVSWKVRPGDEVKVNQTIVEIETAKASVELPCPYDGVIGDLLAEEGQTVEVGAPIITIDAGGSPSERADKQSARGGGEQSGDQDDGERQSVLVGYGPRSRAAKRRPRKAAAGESTGAQGPAASAAPATETSPPVAATLVPERPAPARDSGDTSAPAPRPAGPAQAGDRVSVLAKPPVRKLAKDLGVDLRTVNPSGPGATITRADVSSAAGQGQEAGAPATPSPAATPSAGPSFDASREQRIPIKGVRKHTAAAMVSSAFTAPHVTEFLTVDATPTVEAVERIQQLPEFAEVRVSPLLLAAKALMLAVRRSPMINSTWDEQAQEIVVKEYVNLGIAVASSRGLVVPNLKGAESMSLPELAGGLQGLVRTARDGKTPPEDMQGGTITITNVGVFGVDTGTPILNPGEAAILALGAIREMPWVYGGQVVPRQVVQLSLSFDHRIVDGELGSKFLADIGTMLGDPTAMLAWG